MSSVIENAQLAALEITDGTDLTEVPALLESVRTSVARTAEVSISLPGSRTRDRPYASQQVANEQMPMFAVTLAPTALVPPEPIDVAHTLRLRVATAAAHERMHGHPGFAAAAAGRLDCPTIAGCLRRSSGSTSPSRLVASEAAMTARTLISTSTSAPGRPRSFPTSRSLGARPRMRSAPAALVAATPRIDSEGSLLGRALCSRRIDLGGHPDRTRIRRRAGGDNRGRARRFFLGRGDQQGAMWGDFVERLETLSESPEQATRGDRGRRHHIRRNFEALDGGLAGAETGPSA